MDSKLRQLARERAREDQERRREQSRQRLGRLIERRLKTAFVVPLAEIETFFGLLWEQPTAEAAMWRERWEACRSRILDNGNSQVRALEAELLQYVVDWVGFNLTLGAAEQE